MLTLAVCAALTLIIRTVLTLVRTVYRRWWFILCVTLVVRTLSTLVVRTVLTLVISTVWTLVRTVLTLVVCIV